MPPSSEMAAMVARLEERLAGYERYMKEWMTEMQTDMAALQKDVREIRSTLDKANGGMRTGQWILGGSLASVIAAFAGFYAWVKSWVP